MRWTKHEKIWKIFWISCKIWKFKNLSIFISVSGIEIEIEHRFFREDLKNLKKNYLFDTYFHFRFRNRNFFPSNWLELKKGEASDYNNESDRNGYVSSLKKWIKFYNHWKFYSTIYYYYISNSFQTKYKIEVGFCSLGKHKVEIWDQVVLISHINFGIWHYSIWSL